MELNKKKVEQLVNNVSLSGNLPDGFIVVSLNCGYFAKLSANIISLDFHKPSGNIVIYWFYTLTHCLLVNLYY